MVRIQSKVDGEEDVTDGAWHKPLMSRAENSSGLGTISNFLGGPHSLSASAKSSVQIEGAADGGPFSSGLVSGRPFVFHLSVSDSQDLSLSLPRAITGASQSIDPEQGAIHVVLWNTDLEASAGQRKKEVGQTYFQ